MFIRITFDDRKGLANSNVKRFFADLSFCMQLAEMSKNRVFQRIVEVLREMQVKFLEDFNQIPAVRKCATAYHEKIYKAIKAFDPVRAAIQLRKHLEDVLCTFQKEHKKPKNI